MEKWEEKDFELNKIFWKDRNLIDCLKIRQNNLLSISKILNSLNIFHFLEGNTLNYLFSHGQLDLHDHDDDLGIFYKDRLKIINNLEKFIQEDFQLIRNNKLMVSFCRSNRYIDICIFKKSFTKIGYGNKQFPKQQFKSFAQVNYLDKEFNIPCGTSEMLKMRYEN